MYCLCMEAKGFLLKLKSVFILIFLKNILRGVVIPSRSSYAWFMFRNMEKGQKH